MDVVCRNCGRALREGMKFCPSCGLPVGESGPPAPVGGREGTLRFSAPGQPPYPMPAFYPPPMYMGQLTGRRVGAVAGAVILLVSGLFAFLAGLIYIFESWFQWVYWLVMGLLCFLGFAFSILALIAVVRRTWRFLVPIACVLLVLSGVLSLVDFLGFAFLILVTAIVGTVLVGASWGQFHEPRGMVMYGQYPMAPPSFMGMPPPMMAPMPIHGHGWRPSEREHHPAAGAPPPPLWRSEEDAALEAED